MPNCHYYYSTKNLDIKGFLRGIDNYTQPTGNVMLVLTTT